MTTTSAEKQAAAETLKKRLVKNAKEGRYWYIGNHHVLVIERNWQPIAGYPYKWRWTVRRALDSVVVSDGTDNTLGGICYDVQSYFGGAK